jgi:hypothetical protein
MESLFNNYVTLHHAPPVCVPQAYSAFVKPASGLYLALMGKLRDNSKVGGWANSPFHCQHLHHQDTKHYGAVTFLLSGWWHELLGRRSLPSHHSRPGLVS